MEITVRTDLPPVLWWAEELESGRWRQGTKALHRVVNDEMCCLGVACALAVAAGVIPPPVPGELDEQGDVYAYRAFPDEEDDANNITELPAVVADWLGLASSTGVFLPAQLGLALRDRVAAEYTGEWNLVLDHDMEWDLTMLNDRGVAFPTIAGVIREVWGGPAAA